MQPTESQPSTSAQALQSNQKVEVASSSGTVFQRWAFKKFKDDNKKNSSNPRAKISQKFTRLTTIPTPSPSQFMTKRILRSIKKKRIPLGLHRISKSSPNDVPNEIYKDFKISVAAQSIPASTEAVSDDLDDDCVCIDPQPEVILIDEEILPMDRIVELSENSNCISPKFKPYQRIGSLRSTASSSLNILTSTPVNNGNHFYTDTIPSKGFASISMIQDCTLVEPKTADSDVVVIDDTLIPTSNEVISRRKTRHDTDDSVIFVSEKLNNITCRQPSPAPQFIPLNTPVEESHFRIREPTPPPIVKRARNALFNKKEQKQIKQYNENAYNPNDDDPALHTKKRMVIIDGSNVAYQHALNKEFSVKGLKICLDYFEKMGHEAKAVVPQFRLQKQKSSDSSGLEQLHKDGKIVFTPCKNLPGKSSTSYDDRFVLQLAAELDAVVVSNDNYRDLIHENPAFKKIIENRVIGYTWCNDLFILPKDPYGKWGPELKTILNRT